jgi:hypothetical protein
LQALQNFGHVVPFSTLLAAFASFHSTAHFFCRSRAASWPALGSFLDYAVLSEAGACCCAAAVDTNRIGAVIIPTPSAAANMTLCMSSLPFISTVRLLPAGNRPQSAT